MLKSRAFPLIRQRTDAGTIQNIVTFTYTLQKNTEVKSFPGSIKCDAKQIMRVTVTKNHTVISIDHPIIVLIFIFDITRFRIAAAINR